MNARESWYNVERVSHHGSVILRDWVSQHGPEAKRLLAAARHEPKKRLYAGASIDRLTSEWTPINTSGDAELITSLRLLRARSRQICRDNEHAKNAVRLVANNVINTGIGLQSTVQTAGGKMIERFNQQIEDAFTAWKVADSCHTAGKLHFHDVERLAIMSLVRDGEVLIRIVRKPFGRDNRIPFALEIIEADRLVDNYSQASAPGTGNSIRMGVETDEWLRPVAYWLYPTHPGDYQFSTFVASRYIRVPADEIIHLYLIDRWPQTRGEPWFHAAIKRLHNASGYEEAEIVAARASASVMGIVTSPEVPESDDIDDQTGDRLTDLSPGTVHHLLPGESFTGFSPTRPNAAVDAFMRHMLRCVAAGIGCSYSALTKDFSQANYSSERAAQLEDRILWRILQGWFIRNFRERVHREWLDAAVLAGAIAIPDYFSNRRKYQSVRFKPPGWSWIDPTKEVAAYKEAVRCGFMTLSDVIGLTSGGVDPDDVFKSRRAELDLIDALRLTFDTNPEQVDEKGKARPISEEPGEADDPQEDSDDADESETAGEPDGDESTSEPDVD